MNAVAPTLGRRGPGAAAAWLLGLPALAAMIVWAAMTSAADPTGTDATLRAAYSEKLRPLLAERCFSCHGSLAQEAGLRLDTVALMVDGGDSGPAVVKGDAAASLILARTSDTDPATRMPPEGEGEPLSAEQLALLSDWIAAGCPAPADEKPEADVRSHWAFRSLERPGVPTVANAGWVRNPIDAFVAERHAQAGVAPQPEPPRHVLVRRLYVDLIGLPPQPEELAAITADAAPDWYERLVDRLLDDPRHGERWARHWMDVWRYSDWWGLEEKHRMSAKHMWHFRDWIVENLNADTGYDEMLRQMLAADELYPDDLDKLRATGFLARNWNVYNRNQWMDETVEHVGKGLLGLTMNCSKCHAHKYDPIQQADYYRLRAFFEPYLVRLDLRPGDADLDQDGVPRIYDGRMDDPTYLFVRGNDLTPDKSQPIRPGVPALLAFEELAIEPVALPETAYRPERRPWVIDTHLAAARKGVERAAAAVAKQASPETEQGLVAARAKLTAVELRAAAMRAAWAAADAPSAAPGDPLRTAADQAAAAALKAERELALAQAWAGLAAVDERLREAVASKRTPARLAAIEKELTAAREKLEKAQKAAAEPGGTFTPLPGAAWEPTNYVKANDPDPFTGFPQTSTGRRTALARWMTDPRNPLPARVAANQIWMRHMGRPLVTTVFDFGRKGNVPSHPALLEWLASELVAGPAGGHPWSMKNLHRLIVTSATYRMGSSLAGAETNRAADPDNVALWRREPMRLEAQVVRDAILALAGTLDSTRGGPSVREADQAASRRRSLYFWHSDISRNQFLVTFDDALVKECYRREQSIVPQQALALVNAGLIRDSAAAIADRIAAAEADDDAFLADAFVTVLGRGPSADEREACAAAVAAWRALPESQTPGPVDRARVNLVWSLLNHTDFVTLR
jgi:hypothetical protein